MSYEIVTDAPPPREPWLLVREPVPIPGAAEVDGAVPTYIPYDLVAPGLYPDETVYRLGTGEKVALSISASIQSRSQINDPAERRIITGGGMEFIGWARVIEDDGSTMLDKAGCEMELEFRHPVDAATFARLDDGPTPAEARISREIMLLMLGEPPTMVPIHVDPDAPVIEVATDDADWKRNPSKAPPGTVLQPGATEAPLIGWSDELRLNASIVHALKMFQRASPEIDVATLLSD